MPLPKLSDNNSGAIAIQIYTADIKDLIFAFNISLRRTLVAGPKSVHLRRSWLYFQEK